MIRKKTPKSKRRAKPSPQPKQRPEPEGGPFARSEAFLTERAKKLQPKQRGARNEEAAGEEEGSPESEEEGPASGQPAAREPARRTIGPTPGDPDFRRRVIGAYRERQQLQIEPPPSARARGRARFAAAPQRTRDEEVEDELFGTEPPVAPAPPPANNWIPIGPSVLRQGQGGTLPSTSGRAVGIAVATGGNRVYVASANGGVWRSDDAGESWRSLMDAWDLNPTTLSSDSLSCGSIAIDPGNPDRIFVGTGEGNEATFLGVGPVFSPDGGTNWVTEPVSPGSPSLGGQGMNAVAVDPGNTDRVVAGTFLGVYRREPNPGAGGGFHWALKAGPAGRVKSVVAARAGGTTTFYAAPANGPVFSSTDGHAWAIVGAGFPAANVGRVGLAVRPTDPTVVYALVAATNNSILGIWRLDTASGQWRQVTGHPADLFGTAMLGFQGTYDLAIAVDPNDANRLFLGGSTRASGGEWSGCVYRSSVTSAGAGPTLTFSMTNTYIGNSVHADIHCLTFAPGDSNKLWLGCDGGVFYSTTPTGAGDIFIARNTGLQTVTMNKLDHHPREDAVVFAGTQDNGGARFTGEEAWLHSVFGDCGDFVINWNDPYRVLATYVGSSIYRTSDGGTRYNYAPVPVALPVGDSALFYAPLMGTPPSGTPAEAERVAFGSRRVWISETFGGAWASIPSNAAGDDLGSQVRALRFASFNKLYAGTINGRVYRFTRAGAAWTRTRLDTMGGTNALGIAGVITSIAIDPADAAGDSIYISLGGNGDYRHVWHFNGTQWQQRSGPSAAALTSLLDVQHNAIVCDPANPATLFVGADIGVWRSTNGGAAWAPFSSGLPDAAVMDLDLHHPRRLLRASTYGRGVFEYSLDAVNLPGIELYLRDTQLDQGRFASVNGLADPTAQGQTVLHYEGPDIKLDTPDVAGNYQFPIAPGTTIDFEEFTNRLTDDFRNVATHATATITTRVYVQVHNRGVTPASDVRVMLLLANASAGLPALPAGFATNVQNGTTITTANWKTVGFVRLNDVRVGFPRIAAFELTSNLLPPPATLAGNHHHCVLALLHHAQDPFTATQTVTDLLSIGERKSAHKNLTVVQFTGTLPPTPPPVVMAVRLHNSSSRRKLATTLRVRLFGYRGRVRLYLPPLELEGSFSELIRGGKAGSDYDDFKRWAKEHLVFLKKNQATKNRYNKDWTRQRTEDVEAALKSGLMFTLGRKDPVQLANIIMAPASRHTVFLLFDPPTGGSRSGSFPIQVQQLAASTGKLIGGLSARIEIVPKPK